jgi:uncharacterized delta-60 repeat protein
MTGLSKRCRTHLSAALAVPALALSLAATLPVAAAAGSGEGDFDDGFAQDGRARASFVSNGNDEARAVALAPGGKIVVAGLTFNAAHNGYDMGVVRYNRDGTLDTTFNHSGLKSVSFGPGTAAEGFALAVQPDQRIVVAGRIFAQGTFWWGVARLTPAGALDPTFGTGGTRILSKISSGQEALTSLALQADGKIVAVGSANGATGLDFTVIRLKPNGAFDGTFGSGGVVHTPIGPSSDFAYSVLVQPDGRLVVGGAASYPASGHFQSAAVVVRYLPGGGLDPTWGTGGVTVSDLSTDDDEVVHALGRSPDGTIFGGGIKSPAAVTPNGGFLVRYTSGGDLKPSSASGDAGWAAKPAFREIRALVRQRDGKLVAIGSVSNGDQFEVARYDRNFLPDPDFAGDGEATVPFGAHDFDDAYAGAVQRDGKIVVVGRSWTGLFDVNAGGDVYNYATARLIGDATAPTGQRMDALPVFSRSRALHLAWRATDDNTGVRTYDVRVRSAAASRSSYGAWRLLYGHIAKRSKAFTARAGRTYCFAVRARDWAGNVGAWSASRCTAVPLDDRMTAAQGTWGEDGGRADYLRTLLVSGHAGDTLSAQVAFRRLALLARTCDGCGEVRVLLGGKTLKTVDLDTGRTRHRVLLTVATGSTLRAGTLRLRQVSGGEQVAIDGIAVSLE